MNEIVLMTRKDIAKYLDISLRTVDKIIHNVKFAGLIYFGKSVRVYKSALDTYIATGELRELQNNPVPNDTMLTKAEAARMLQVSINSVDRWLIKNKNFSGCYQVNGRVRISKKLLYDYIIKNLQYKI